MPEPDCVTVPVPEMRLLSLMALLLSYTKAALSTTPPVPKLPVVPPAPTCSVPALIVVPPL